MDQAAVALGLDSEVDVWFHPCSTGAAIAHRVAHDSGLDGSHALTPLFGAVAAAEHDLGAH